jgi:hypothetical protein
LKQQFNYLVIALHLDLSGNLLSLSPHLSRVLPNV